MPVREMVLTAMAALLCTVTRAQDSLQAALLREQIVQVTDLQIPIAQKDSLLKLYQEQSIAIGNDSLAAFSAHRLGVLYFGADQFDLALPHYAMAFAMRKELPRIQQEKILRSALWAGMSAARTHQLVSAKSYFNDVISYPRQRYVIMAYRELAKVYWAEGDFTQSELYFRQAFRGQSLLKDFDLLELQVDYLGMKQEEGNVSEFPSLIADTEKFLQRVQPQIASDNVDRKNMLSLLQNLALLCDKVQDYIRCEEYNTLALRYADDDARAGIYNNLGNLMRRTGRTAQAEKYIRDAQHIYRTLQDRHGLALTSDNLGEIFLARKEFFRAQTSFDSAVYYVLGRPYRGNTAGMAPLSTERKVSIATYFGDKARGLYAWYRVDQDRGRLDTALTFYSYADDAIDLIRRTLAQDEAQFHWRSKARDIYIPAVGAAIEAGREDLALQFLDRGKALVLTEALQKSHIAESMFPDSVRSLVSELAKEVNRLEQAVYKAEQTMDGNTDKVMTVQDSLLKAQERYSDLNNIILQKYPNYFPDYAFDVNAIRSALAPDQCILSYFLTQDTVLCGRVNPSGISFLYLCERRYLDSLLTGLNILMTEMEIHSATGNTMPENEYATHLKNLAETCYALHKILLSSWHNLPERVMIIADEQLNSVNFEMLLTDMPDPDTPLYRWPFAIKKYCFTYNHSIMNWLELTKPRSVSWQVIGIAPVFRPPYQSLTYSQEGLQDIHGFPVRVLRGKDANRHQIAALGQHAILDFQTHAVVAGQSDYSFILLNTPDGDLDSLYLRDVYQFKFPGVFVILTACQTHVGDLVRGEGIISLARAFTYAGASGLITSLWKVGDYTSSIIMKRFYAALARGMDKDAALREAKLDYLNDRQNELEEHPFYWASLIQIGNTAPIKQRHQLIWYAMGAALGILGVSLLVRRSLKRKPVQRAA